MGRFATTAELYEQYRPPYSAEFFRAVAHGLTLSRQQALIDLEATDDGRGGFRTCDLSRVKRALSH